MYNIKINIKKNECYIELINSYALFICNSMCIGIKYEKIYHILFFFK